MFFLTYKTYSSAMQKQFTTLFGLLAVEIAVEMQKAGHTGLKTILASIFLLIALVFVYRSFYGMRISGEQL